MPVKRQHQGSTSTSRKKTKVVKSVWNSTDDWTTLVADSSLSTSSISTRRPRPRGLQTLVICCQEAAIRSFKILWEARGSSSTGTDGRGMGREWREKWQFVPDHLKYRVRDGVFSRWGHLLTIAMIHDVFLVPPEIYLPAGELPAIAETKHLKPLFPSEETRNWYTSLVLTHAAKPSDVSVAGLIHHLPELQTINLKGCSLVETKTVETILKRSVKLRKINLKGTKVGERHVKALLETFGDQMETFKVDKVIFNNPNETFPSSYPSITHLCLPGAILHGPHTSTARFLGRTNYPKPRPIHPESHFTFPRLPILFPNITHLYLSGLLIPPNIEMIFPPNQLQKLVLGPNGPPVPIPVLVSLLKNQEQSLRSIHLGNLAWVIRKDEEDQLIGVLDKCRKMKNFEIEKEHDVGLELLSVILAIVFFGSWRGSLKRLSIRCPTTIHLNYILQVRRWWSLPECSPPPIIDFTQSTALEILELPDLKIRGVDEPEKMLCDALRKCTKLRSLDLSGCSLSQDHIFDVLDHCPLISRIDLTSCRGVDVRDRRRIFEAWEESRSQL